MTWTNTDEVGHSNSNSKFFRVGSIWQQLGNWMPTACACDLWQQYVNDLYLRTWSIASGRSFHISAFQWAATGMHDQSRKVKVKVKVKVNPACDIGQPVSGTGAKGANVILTPYVAIISRWANCMLKNRAATNSRSLDP